MSETEGLNGDKYEPGLYEICVEGHLQERWSSWFEGMNITLEENGETHLTGPVADQAALHGLLKKIRDLGMPLISVIRVKPEKGNALDVKQ